MIAHSDFAPCSRHGQIGYARLNWWGSQTNTPSTAWCDLWRVWDNVGTASICCCHQQGWVASRYGTRWWLRVCTACHCMQVLEDIRPATGWLECMNQEVNCHTRMVGGLPHSLGRHCKRWWDLFLGQISGRLPCSLCFVHLTATSDNDWINQDKRIVVSQSLTIKWMKI